MQGREGANTSPMREFFEGETLFVTGVTGA